MSSTQLQVLGIRPGINKNTTHYAAEGEWVDSDRIRWLNGVPKTVAGWVKSPITIEETDDIGALPGTTRTIFPFVSLDTTKWIATGSTTALGLILDSHWFDITPVFDNVTDTDILSTTNGSSIVNVNLT